MVANIIKNRQQKIRISLSGCCDFSKVKKTSNQNIAFTTDVKTFQEMQRKTLKNRYMATAYRKFY